jgi:hypothetical protein
MKQQFLSRLALAHPQFAAALGDGVAYGLMPPAEPATELELEQLEQSLGLPLPGSYKALLGCARELTLMGGVLRLGAEHPLLEPEQSRGADGESRRLLRFADYSLEADGDQVLFDVSAGLLEGEYPIIYRSRQASPANLYRLADSFPEFLEQLLHALSPNHE